MMSNFGVFMVDSKWVKIAQDENHLLIKKYFKENILEHLKRPYDSDGEANQPAKILEDAKSTTGKLSRIFDAFDYPVLSIDAIKELALDPESLREFMETHLKNILPTLLNEESTALNDDLIEAIGTERYAAIVKGAGGDAKKVALQFVKAFIVSYGQRFIDNPVNGDDTIYIFTNISPLLTQFANSVTLDGTISPPKTYTLDELKTLVSELDELLKESSELDIPIGNKAAIDSHLLTANRWLSDDMASISELTRIPKLTECIDGAKALLHQDLLLFKEATPSPPQVSWLVRMIRNVFSSIPGSNKWMQSQQERRYLDYFYKQSPWLDERIKKIESDLDDSPRAKSDAPPKATAEDEVSISPRSI
jgi:hypothetical protein